MILALYVKAVALWCGFVAIAAAGAAVREAYLITALGEHRAHQLATLLVCGLVLVAIVGFVRFMAVSRRLAVRIALLWLGLSVWFEFPFGRYVLGIPWARLLVDYDVSAGRLNGLLLLTQLVAPIVVARKPVATR